MIEFYKQNKIVKIYNDEKHVRFHQLKWLASTIDFKGLNSLDYPIIPMYEALSY